MKKMIKFIRYCIDYYWMIQENKMIDKAAKEYAQQEWYYYYSS